MEGRGQSLGWKLPLQAPICVPNLLPKTQRPKRGAKRPGFQLPKQGLRRFPRPNPQPTARPQGPRYQHLPYLDFWGLLWLLNPQLLLVHVAQLGFYFV